MSVVRSPQVSGSAVRDRSPIALVPPLPVGRPAKPIDWGWVAKSLADGRSMESIAEAMDVSRWTIWRAMRRSRVLQMAYGEERHRTETEATTRLRALSPIVVAAIERKVREGDARTVLLLARRLRVAERDFPLISGGGGFDGDPGRPYPDRQTFDCPIEPEVHAALARDDAEFAARYGDAPDAAPGS